MANVFVSYARSDADRVVVLVSALEAHGLSVWWDRSLEQSVDFGSVIDQEIDESGSVIVCWSEAAVRSKWVRGEASRADHQGKYVGAMFQNCLAPTPFNALNNAAMHEWGGAADDMEFLRLLSEVGSKLGRRDLVDRARVQSAVLLEAERRQKQIEQVERLAQVQAKDAQLRHEARAKQTFEDDRAEFDAAFAKVNLYRVAWTLFICLPLWLAFLALSFFVVSPWFYDWPSLVILLFFLVALPGSGFMAFWLTSIGAVSTEHRILPLSSEAFDRLTAKYGSSDPKKWKRVETLANHVQ